MASDGVKVATLQLLLLLLWLLLVLESENEGENKRQAPGADTFRPVVRRHPSTPLASIRLPSATHPPPIRHNATFQIACVSPRPVLRPFRPDGRCYPLSGQLCDQHLRFKCRGDGSRGQLSARIPDTVAETAPISLHRLSNATSGAFLPAGRRIALL